MGIRNFNFSLKKISALLAAAWISGCAGAQAIRTSQNTMIIQASAAPACGPQGAAKVAQTSAAIETIRAGFDRYIIVGAHAANNVQIIQGIGTATTYGTVTSSRHGTSTYRGTTFYSPGPTYRAGSHDQSFAIQMFKDGEPGAEQAISARQILGADWKERVEKRVLTCL